MTKHFSPRFFASYAKMDPNKPDPTILLIRSGTKENREKRKELWNYIKSRDTELYSSLRFGMMGHLTSLSGRVGRVIPISAYKIAQRIVGFN